MHRARSGTFTRWRKSSYSSDSGNCVEIAFRPDQVGVRDSKDPDGPVLAYTTKAWRVFMTAIRTGELAGKDQY
jgi:hypothetical protein